MSTQTELFCIHGFLGSPNDWKPALPPEMHTTYVDLYASSPSISDYSLPALGNRVNDLARLKDTGSSRILAGYSLGGRIALHSLFAEPKLWDFAVIISANPGLTHPAERAPRLKIDAEWARKFASEPWEPLLTEWNAQPVFQGAKTEPRRREEDFNREKLAQSLIDCSLGHQDDFRPRLRNELKIPLLWITGEADQKYSLLAQEISTLNPLIRWISIPQAGHRVLLDQPDAIAELIRINS